MHARTRLAGPSRAPRLFTISKRTISRRPVYARFTTREALVFPSPFLQKEPTATSSQSDLDSYHGSCWDMEWLPQQVHHNIEQGTASLGAILQRWSSTYTNLGVRTLSVATNDASNDAFIFFTTDVVNTGSFGGVQPTQQLSSVHGLYRVHLNEEGQPQDVWLFRSGTREERQHLLKQEVRYAVNSKPELDVSSWLSEDACGWAADPSYSANILMRAGFWADRVMSRNCLSSLVDIASPHLQLLDGTGLLYAPCQGVVAVGHHLMDRALAWDLGPRKVLASVAEPRGNKVFQHWKQVDAVCRATGRACPQQGGSLLVFDAQAQLRHVLEWVEPHKLLRDTLFRDDQDLHRLLSCWPGATGISPEAAAEALVDEAAEQAACLARQEQEWMAW